MKLLSLKMPHQAEWIIETDCPDIISKLEMMYGKYMNEYNSCENPDIKIYKQDDTNYTLTLKDTVINTKRPIFHMNRFLYNNPSYDPNILCFFGIDHNRKDYPYKLSNLLRLRISYRRLRIDRSQIVYGISFFYAASSARWRFECVEKI